MKMKGLTYLKDVTTLKLNQDKCNGCGMCRIVCPHEVFTIEKKTGDTRQVAEIINKDACMECGACARNCPEGAIEVRAGVGCALGIIIGQLRGMGPVCGPDCKNG
jgi:ferredoxin